VAHHLMQVAIQIDRRLTLVHAAHAHPAISYFRALARCA
jgi:hypothetical protein